MRDPYAVLGVRRNAGPAEIKAAWRTMAKAVHPDHNRDDPTAAQRFAEAGRAYELLKDPKLRNRYDTARREADLRRTIEQVGAIHKIDVATRLASTQARPTVHCGSRPACTRQ